MGGFFSAPSPPPAPPPPPAPAEDPAIAEEAKRLRELETRRQGRRRTLLGGQEEEATEGSTILG